jgi:dTDP-4-dehydrorhamnose 3,5-epimerase
MKTIETSLPGVLLIEPIVHCDSRGYFWESHHAERYKGAGMDLPFVQDNHSRSRKNVVRALHAQPQQGKLVMVLRGAIYDVVVDIRPDSPTFRRWFAARLDDVKHHQLYIPPGFAHGFCVLSEEADLVYKTTDYYRQDHQISILWNDPDLAIEWPVTDPILSDRDRTSPRLAQLPYETLSSCGGLEGAIGAPARVR